MGKVFLLNDLMPEEKTDGIDVQDMFTETITNFASLCKEDELAIERKILSAKEPKDTFIGGHCLRDLVFGISDRELKSYAISMLLHSPILSDQYHVGEWKEDLLEDLLELTDENGKSATNEGIACVCSWMLLSLPISDEFKKDSLVLKGKQTYQVLNYYGQNKKNVVYAILGSAESDEAMELKLKYALDAYQINLVDEFKDDYSRMRVEEREVMISRLVTAHKKKCLIKKKKDDNLLRECTCSGDKNMFELKSNSDLGVRFYFKIYDDNCIVFTLIGKKSGYGDKSKKKKGGTVQNKDMKRALDIANRYIEKEHENISKKSLK